jgi:putative ABC transport system permease protein
LLSGSQVIVQLKLPGSNSTACIGCIEIGKLVAIAFIIAIPFAWWIMSKWLQDFVYRVSFSWWIFLVAGAAAFLIALITVSSQAIKAAMANPVTSLRSE